jgi:hypothetical protein
MEEYVKVKELVFGDEPGTGVKTIAFVDQPAIMVNWIAFRDQTQVAYSVTDDDRRIIMSPVLIPNLHIPRKDPKTGEVFAVFMSRETVFQAAYKWMQEGRQNLANDMHQPGKDLNGITWFSSVVTDEKMFHAPEQFKGLPFGTWFNIGKVDNDQVWGDVKSLKYKGISIDGFFEMEEVKPLTIEQIEATTESILKQDW